MDKRQTKSKKPELKQEEKVFVAGAETEEQFEKVLKLLKKWVSAGIVDVRVDEDGDVGFDLPEEVTTLSERERPRGLTDKHVRDIVEDEMPLLISSGLAPSPQRKIKRHMPDQLIKTRSAMDMMVGRAKKAVANLVVGSIREKVLLKRESFGYVIDTLRGHASTKKLEANDGEEVEVPCVSLQINFVKAGAKRTLVLDPKTGGFGLERNDNVSVNLELHKEELKDFISGLQKLLKRIGEQ